LLLLKIVAIEEDQLSFEVISVKKIYVLTLINDSKTNVG
jgi:hypothetical protein